MDTLTLEWPQTLAQQVQAHGISQQGLNSMFIKMVKLFIKESQSEISCPLGTSAESAWPDPSEFTHRLIANNKELFEELARL